jgi:YidC/Oxa1 family membrane protein insertase
MDAWLFVVDLLRTVIFSLAHVLGGSVGGSILVVSLALRIALLPLTIRWARNAIEHRRRQLELEPEMARLRKRFANDPTRLSEETLALYKKRGHSVLPQGALAGTLIQLPINGALYQAIVGGVRRAAGFLWIRDLARPDVLLATAAAVLAACAAAIAGESSAAARNAAIVSGAITFLLAWRLSAGLGLYWLASNGVGLVQSILLRPATRRVHA